MFTSSLVCGNGSRPITSTSKSTIFFCRSRDGSTNKIKTKVNQKLSIIRSSISMTSFLCSNIVLVLLRATFKESDHGIISQTKKVLIRITTTDD